MYSYCTIQLATIRLALPTGWLNPRHNAFSNESHVDHHARTITIFHLRMDSYFFQLPTVVCDKLMNGWYSGNINILNM
jgi:hypothetical protein